MRHALFLVLALGLAACAPQAKAPDQPSPVGVGVDTGGIETTPLDAPTNGGAASAQSAATGAATNDTASAPAEPAAQTVPVAEATSSTPHPEARPGESGDSAAAPAPEPAPKSQPQMLCEASGGFWGQSGTSGGFLCQKMMKDGGKVCHKKGDCTGECLGPSQTCSPVAPLMGCNDVMDAEGRRVTLCLD